MKKSSTRVIGVSAAMAVGLAGMVQAGTWLKGDLHNHSTYSDGDSSVKDVLASAEKAGLNFFALTDHDGNQNGQPKHWADSAFKSSKMALLYGVEWTTGKGHANVWGAQPFDYSALWAANRANDAEAAVKAAHAANCLFSLNHPNGYACEWKYAVPSAADGVEIWNGPMLLNFNLLATYGFYDTALLQGRRLNAFGGSDTHYLKGFLAQFQGHGCPTTWAYAEANTAEAVIAALRAGRTTLSHKPDGTRVELSADLDKNGSYETLVGSNVAGANQQATLAVAFAGAGRSNTGKAVELPASLVNNINRKSLSWSDYLWLVKAFAQTGVSNVDFAAAVKNGKLHKGWLLSKGGKTLTFNETVSASGRSYYRAELYGDAGITGLASLIYGVRTGVTSPIFVNF